MGHNSVAVRVNLRRRGMDLDTKCVMFNRLDEDGGHLFLKCKFAKQLWRELNLEEVRIRLAEQNSAKTMLALIWQLEKNVQMRAIMLLWHWCLERNQVREGERRRTASELAFIINMQADEFLKIATKTHKVQNNECRHWCKPAADILKINVDGSFIAGTRKGGWGFVIRDSEGTVMHAGAGAIPRAMDAFHTEVLACHAGLKAASEKGMTKVMIDTDSMMLVMALKGNTFALAPAGGIIHEIKVVASSFVLFSANYSPRVCNKVAHALAASGCNCSPGADLIWDGTPAGMETLVAEDPTG
ncbi:hypothetical protein C2845_PM03G16420 [Panicum miliaceum]|uniref:RNase H type-1 domain-containing protein n=1 Tax=Panicum miliaceum TaxID=4540 RepID=A0A3L6T4R7_PANMI|nr:hypothetical protein C2845_PM03G16420 [Panicum miliaceum]